MSTHSPNAPTSTIDDRRAAYLLLRLILGVSLLGHGLVRLPKLPEFRSALLNQFAESVIPPGLVSLGGYGLPVVEFVVGVTITFGLFTRVSVTVATLEMIALIFGSTTIENWSAIGDQIIHAVPLAALLAFAEYNSCSLDHLVLRRKRRLPEEE